LCAARVKLQFDQHEDIAQLSDCSLPTCKTNITVVQAPSMFPDANLCASTHTHILTITVLPTKECIKVKGVEFSMCCQALQYPALSALTVFFSVLVFFFTANFRKKYVVFLCGCRKKL